MAELWEELGYFFSCGDTESVVGDGMRIVHKYINKLSQNIQQRYSNLSQIPPLDIDYKEEVRSWRGQQWSSLRQEKSSRSQQLQLYLCLGVKTSINRWPVICDNMFTFGDAVSAGFDVPDYLISSCFLHARFSGPDTHYIVIFSVAPQKRRDAQQELSPVLRSSCWSLPSLLSSLYDSSVLFSSSCPVSRPANNRSDPGTAPLFTLA